MLFKLKIGAQYYAPKIKKLWHIIILFKSKNEGTLSCSSNVYSTSVIDNKHCLIILLLTLKRP